VHDSLFGTNFAPVLMVLEAELPRDRITTYVPNPARRLLTQFLAAQYDLAAQIRQFALQSAASGH
jgi:hypothetical protein